MSKERRNFIYLADGIAILQDYAYVSPDFVKEASDTTFADFISHANEDVIDLNATRLLCIQLSPFELEADPKRYRNTARDFSKLHRALHYYQKIYPDQEFFYRQNIIPDDEVPQIAKDTGTKVMNDFEVIALKYENGQISDDDPQTNLASFYLSDDEKKFNISVRKRFFTVDRKRLKRSKNKIRCRLADPKRDMQNKINRFAQIVHEAYVSDKDMEEKASKYLDTLPRFEDELCQRLVFDNYDEQDTMPLLEHECRHLVNKILLQKRYSDPNCTPLKTREILQILVHDEISAAIQETFESFKQIMRNQNACESVNFADLAPIHYQKFIKANPQSRADIFKKPFSLVEEISQNWYKNFFPLYQDQFCNTLQDYQSIFPASLVSFNKSSKESDEYRLEKKMLYTFAIYNPATGQDEYIDCSAHSKDMLPKMSADLRQALKDMEFGFRKEQYDLQSAGIDSELILKARAQNHAYYQKKSGKSTQILQQAVSHILHVNDR